MLVKAKIRGLTKSYEEGSAVWLDIQKSCEELKPARKIHRSRKVLCDFETSMPEPLTVEKLRAGKTIKVGGHRAASVLDGTLRFTV